ncbi:MAG TPA: hypothetical protein VJ866_09695 [Pyrinomonadaceae bacterium]|nr:hypothetical protein [Pyrinomonadaceae bacterium]
MPRSKAPDEERLAGYLLGRLTEEEQEGVERFYFGGEENLDLLAAAEDDLIDSYVRGELTPRERERFEEFFLRSPERRERVETARALDRLLKKTQGDAPHPAPLTHPRFRRAALWLPLAACLLITAGSAFLVYRMLAARRADEAAQSRRAEEDRAAQPTPQQQSTLPQQSTPQQPDSQSARETPLTPQPTSPQPTNSQPASPQTTAPRQQPGVASILLTAGTSRGGGASQTLNIARGAERVKLLAEVSGQGYQSYEASLRTAEGAEVWRGSVKAGGRKRGAAVVAFTPPARVFRSGDYTLSVTGLRSDGGPDAAGEYQFRVSRR